MKINSSPLASALMSFSMLLSATPSGVQPNVLRYLNMLRILLILSVAESYAYTVTQRSFEPAILDVPLKDICTRSHVVVAAACAIATADVIACSNLCPDIDPDASIEI